MNYFADNLDVVKEMKQAARQRAIEKLDFKERTNEIEHAFLDSEILKIDRQELETYLKADKKKNSSLARVEVEKVAPAWIVDKSNRLARFVKRRKKK